MVRAAVLATTLLLAACANSAPKPVDLAEVGPPGSNARAEIYRPEGAGPFPAMVVLHGCSGVTNQTHTWGAQLSVWGYIAIVVDSLGPRGKTNICNRGMEVPPLARAADAFAAAAYLRTLPEVRHDSIGVIGFSHGGWTVLKAVLKGTVEANRGPPFAAAVAFYPACDPPGSPLATDTLILIGDADDWTPARRCVRWEALAERDGHVLEMTVYPGALHAFDSMVGPRSYYGHMIGRDPAAAADATTKTRDFLKARLAPP